MPPRQPPSVLAYEQVEHTARNDRLTTGAAFTPGVEPLSGRSGALIGPAGAAGEVTLPDQATVRVGPGIFVMQGQVDAAQGQYVAINDGNYDQPHGVTQHASQYRRVAVVAAVLDSVMAGIDPVPVLDENGNPVLDEGGNPVVEHVQPTNLWDVYPVPGDLSPTAPGPSPDITSDDFQAYAVLGWVNVPPAGQPLTYTPNPTARVGSRTGILPALPGDDTEGSHDAAYRHHPTLGLQYWDAPGGAWRSIFTSEMTAARLRLTSTTDASAASTGHGLQIGPTAGENVAFDNNEILGRNAGAIAPLYLGRPALRVEGSWDLAAASTPGNALVTKDHLTARLSRTTAETLRLTATADASESSTGHALQIGPTNGANLRLDNNEIVGVDGGALANIGLTRPVLSAESWNLAAGTTPGNALVTKAHVAPALADTGWTIFQPASGWAVVAAAGGCRYRVKAGIFFLRFAATRASWGDGANLYTLPEAFRPAYEQTAIGTYGGAFREVKALPSGVVEVLYAGTAGLVLSASWPID